MALSARSIGASRSVIVVADGDPQAIDLPRIHPLEAVRIVSDNILAHFEVVPIERQDYLEVAGDGERREDL